MLVTTFWQLLDKYSIKIPMLQRDYAQGRADNHTRNVRSKIIRDLLNALSRADNHIDLSFIYGSVKNNELLLLDGQQRLTTLYLLHWYFLFASGQISEENKNRLKKFSYETRASSKMFCKELVENGLSQWPGRDQYSSQAKLAELIEDSKWFISSWKHDPTINGMLVMLDELHENFCRRSDLFPEDCWNKLVKADIQLITFQFLDIVRHHLSDDLYIKMNSRGTSLTDFEVFKARFEERFCKPVKTLNVILDKTFSYRIDTCWTDLFWRHKDPNNSIDDIFLRFISGIAIALYAQNKRIDSNEEEVSRLKIELEKTAKGSVTPEAIERKRIAHKIAALHDNPANVRPEDFFDEEDFQRLIDCFDIYSSNSNDILNLDLPLWSYCGRDSSMFKEFIKEPTYKQRVLFYAQTVFLLKCKEFDQSSFLDWMRVVRNIVENSTIDSSDAFIGAIDLLNELVIGCGDIYEFISNNTIKSGFAKEQLAEEILKSKLLLNNVKNREVVFKIEDTRFCKGSIGFALQCIDCECILQHKFP